MLFVYYRSIRESSDYCIREFFRFIMGRRKKNDEKSAKQIRGPGRKAKKQGEPTFPKELFDAGRKKKDFLPSFPD